MSPVTAAFILSRIFVGTSKALTRRALFSMVSSRDESWRMLGRAMLMLSTSMEEAERLMLEEAIDEV
jgi:hypothetical protein